MSKLIGMRIKAISIESSLVNIHRHQRPPNVLSEVQKEEVLLQGFFLPSAHFPHAATD